MRSCAIFGIACLILVICNLGFSQGTAGCYPPCAPSVQSCPMNCPSPPAPVTKTVQVDVPVPCAPPVRCMPAPLCSPYQCCPPPCPPPCPTRPVRVRVDVVVRPESPKTCMPQRYCCENPPVFEPIFYHAAWMLKSIVAAPLGLGDSMLGHGTIRQPVPPPIPVACIPRPIACYPPRVNMCAPLDPQCMPPCQPIVQCSVPGPPVPQVPGCPPRKAIRPIRSAPIAQ